MPLCVAISKSVAIRLTDARCRRSALVGAPRHRHASTTVVTGRIHHGNVKGTRQCASRSAAADISTADTEVVKSVKDRKYVMVSGKGGVGKTSLSSSLAIKFAEAGHTTLIVSTDPAHSLGDSLGQPLPGGRPVPIEGTTLPVWGMEIDPDRATEAFKSFATTKGKEKVKVRFQSTCSAVEPLGLRQALPQNAPVNVLCHGTFLTCSCLLNHVLTLPPWDQPSANPPGS